MMGTTLRGNGVSSQQRMTSARNNCPICRLGPLLLVFFALVSPARAEQGVESDPLAVGPTGEDYAQFTGKPIRNIEIDKRGRWFDERLQLRWVKINDPFYAAQVRSAVRDLLSSGRLARAEAYVTPWADGVSVRVVVELRRIVAKLSLEGAALSEEELFELASLKTGDEIGESGVEEKLELVRRIHAERGYPHAKVTLGVRPTTDPLGVDLHFRVVLGAAATITKRRFEVAPDPSDAGLKRLLGQYDVETGDRYDEPSLVEADRELAERLKQQGWYDAGVTHTVEPEGRGMRANVLVKAGPKFSIAFMGNRSFDVDRLLDVLEIETSDDRSIDGFVDRLKKHYASYGFWDVHVAAQVDDRDPRFHRVTFTIDEGGIVRVVSREFPCLSGTRSVAEVTAEIDSFLSEELPGAEILGPADPQRIDAGSAAGMAHGARPVPLNPNPYVTYVPRVYERALKHLQDLYRSEGYLAASVGPVQVLRRRCALGSQPGECRPIGSRVSAPAECRIDDIGLPLDEPSASAPSTCTADPRRVTQCEPEIALRIPIKLGPRTQLWDVIFDGNSRVTEHDLGVAAAMPLGKPLPLMEVELARRRILDEYAERGFAYADVQSSVEPSPDHTRARVRFSIQEGEQVMVGGIIVKGARQTSEGLIRSRVALEVNQPYRRSSVRATEERLGTLGTFSNIRVGLEDPYVPAKQKNVVIELLERIPQYFELYPGFRTGEGFRLGVDYGHRNVGGKAIQLTLRTRVSYLPDALILEPDVREKYQRDVSKPLERLERLISLQAVFPDIGLGPLFRLGLEGLDVHDNARDYGLTKEAFVSTLTYRPNRRVTLQLDGSLERNDVKIFDDQKTTALKDYLISNPSRALIFRVPQGTTGALAQRFTVSWDRRDVPLDARRGTFATTSLEHVTAQPLGSSRQQENLGKAYCSGQSVLGKDNNPFAPSESEFLRWTSRVAGYIPLTRRGTTLAVSFRWGMNYQMRECSRTYPDRLFFLGGVDTIRGFLQGSMIPEDMAQQILDGGLPVEQVVMRGGNFFINPRAELRLPLNKLAETVVFVDAGNVWSQSPTDAGSSSNTPNYLRLRYSVGTGLRLNTPVGPLVFDYGFNVERVLDKFYPERSRQRFWEDLGAFSFSIGLY